MKKPKVLFVYDNPYDHLWRDGLWAALKELEKDFEVYKFNLQTSHTEDFPEDHDFVLGWGAFNSRVDKALQPVADTKKGLCIAGNTFPPTGMENYNVLFYETEWYKPQIAAHSNIMHAFGVNTDIMNPWPEAPVIWDYLGVGSFAYWKRWPMIIQKPGSTKMVVGEIQKGNWTESFDIMSDLLLAGVAVSDMLYPTKLRNIYNCAAKIYVPADINGGGERTILEARACGRPVEIEGDNPKLAEILNGPVYDHHYYAAQLKKGIESCL